MENPLRYDSDNFPSKCVNLMHCPSSKTMEFVDTANEKYTTATSVKGKKEIAQNTGCKGPYALIRKLPLHDRMSKVPVDPMHLISNILSHSVNLISGTEDSIKVRKQEKSIHRFPSSWVKDNDDVLPAGPFSLTKENIRLADSRAMNVLVPHGFGWRPREIFNRKYAMKSHEWKLLSSSGILKFCLRGMLGSRQRSTLFKLFDVLKRICAESVIIDAIQLLEEHVHTVLALIERDFPLSLQVIVFHLLHHLPRFIKMYGPVYSFWMYRYERFNSWIKRRALNRRYPEATVIQTYLLSEWAYFMELSGKFEGVLPSDDSFEGENPDTSTLLQSERAKFCVTGDVFELLCSYYDSTDISFNGVKLKHYHYMDEYGRTVILNGADTEKEHSYSRSSYVSRKSCTQVGRIIFLFQHLFCDITTIFAYISWFDGPFLDADSKLNYVLCGVEIQSVIPVTELSKPLVVAYDEEESSKLWILNL